MQYLIPRGFMVEITTPLEGDGGNQHTHTHKPGAPPGDDVGYAVLYKQSRIGIETWIFCVFSSTNIE